MNEAVVMIVSATFAALLTIGCTKEHSGCVLEDRSCKMERHVVLYKKHFSGNVPLDDTQNGMLTKMIRDVQSARDQRCAEHLYRGLAVLTNQFGVFSSGKKEFADLEKTLRSIFESSAFPTNGTLVFTSPQELNGFLQFNLGAATFLGYLRLHSCGYGYGASSVEALVYRGLKSYEAHYAETRETDFQSVVSSHLRRWICSIESRSGVSRIAAYRILAYELERLKEIGDITYEDAVRAARSHAQGLINCGYTPKWLEEDFPLVKGAPLDVGK